MKTTIQVICFLLSCVCQGQILTIVHQDGRSIDVYPHTLSKDTFKFTKYGKNYTIMMNQLTEESQSAVISYFERQADLLERNKSNRNEEITELIFSNDHSTLERIKMSDPVGDFMPIHPYSEMDFTSFSISKGRARSIIIKVEFAKPIPSKPEFEQPYRLWVKLDLDNNSETGLMANSSIGEDMSIAINGWGEAYEWDYYTVPKSERGKKAKIEIDDINYFKQTLSFELKCSEFSEDEIISLAVSSCANGGNNVDRAPNKSTSIPFSFRADMIKQLLLVNKS